MSLGVETKKQLLLLICLLFVGDKFLAYHLRYWYSTTPWQHGHRRKCIVGLYGFDWCGIPSLGYWEDGMGRFLTVKCPHQLVSSRTAISSVWDFSHSISTFSIPGAVHVGRWRMPSTTGVGCLKKCRTGPLGSKQVWLRSALFFIHFELGNLWIPSSEQQPQGKSLPQIPSTCRGLTRPSGGTSFKWQLGAE